MSKIKILLVDDEKDFRESTARTLKRRGFDVDGVAGGTQALEYLKTVRPDLIVLDLKMADMDGITTLKHIRGEHGDIPVIILTGHGDFESALSGITLEIVDFIQKPVDVDHLAHRIRDLLSVKHANPLSERTVLELMVGVQSYRSVYSDQTIAEALEELRNSLDAPVSGKVTETGHRTILVMDRKGDVVGLLRRIDVLGMAAPEWMFDDPYRSFYTGMFLAQCKVIGGRVVGEYFENEEMISIQVHTPLMEAAVLMAENRLINLPVMWKGKVVGILRDKDVFREILHIVLGD